MSRRYYRKRRRRSNDLGSTLIAVGILVVLATYNSLSAESVQLIVGVGLVLACSFAALVLFAQYKLSQRRKQKLRALQIVDIQVMDGLVFEKYVAELLKDQGYTKVRLTE